MGKYNEIIKLFPNRAFERVSAGALTTYKTGGEIGLTVYPESGEEVFKLLEKIKKSGFDFFILGQGSNVLVSDAGFDGVFVLTEKMKKTEFSKQTAFAECGALWDPFVGELCSRGLSGLEKTSYIPGTVGGAVRMNAGAFGQETFDCLVSFSVLDKKTMSWRELKKNEIRYGYRFVEGIEDYFVLSAVFKFETASPAALAEVRFETVKKRKDKQPLEYPSAGSVFKRPPGGYASSLIDSSGLKGLRIGGAAVSKKHAGFIINYDRASASDIYRLAMKVKEEVFKKTGTELELEQILVGKF